MNDLELTVEFEKAQELNAEGGEERTGQCINECISLIIDILLPPFFFFRLPQFKEEAKSFVGANMKKVNSN